MIFGATKFEGRAILTSSARRIQPLGSSLATALRSDVAAASFISPAVNQPSTAV